MFIAKNLRRLRLMRELTQEEVADRIGVTGQAVSKWERGECYPDITLLPGLANFYQVSVDELIGMDELCNEEKLNGVFREEHNLSVEGRYREAADVLEGALRIFPGNHGLMSELAMTLALVGGDENMSRAIGLCERVLQESTNEKLRGTTFAALCHLHGRSGAPEKAAEVARALPHARESREFMLPKYLPKSEREAYLRENLPGMLMAIGALVDGDTLSEEDQLRSILLGQYRGRISADQAMERIARFLE